MSKLSFSTEVKNELCEVKFSREEAFSELAAMILFGENIENGQFELKTDRAEIAARIQAVYKKAFKEELLIDIIKGKRSYSVSVDKNTAESVGVYLYEDGEIELDEDIYEEDTLMKAFLRGAFIISGTMTDPFKEYCCELLTYNENMAYLVLEMLENFNIKANTVKRNKHFVTYIKDINSVSDFLNVTGAHKSLMELIVTQIEKNCNNRSNREGNCRAANFDKTIKASVEQCKAIIKIQDSPLWDSLDEQTRSLALIRQEHFDSPLSKIGEMMVPPMTKSSVLRRMNKLIQIAEEL